MNPASTSCLVVAIFALMAIAAEAGRLTILNEAGEPLKQGAPGAGAGAALAAGAGPDGAVAGFGFLSDYYCVGRVFDEPRRMRLKCTKNPPRKLNCGCQDSGNSQVVRCTCDPPITHGKEPVILRDKSERVSQDDTDLDP